MRVVFFLIILLLFCFTVFMFGDLETAIASIDAGEALRPLLQTTPVLLIGAVFFVLAYSAVKE